MAVLYPQVREPYRVVLNEIMDGIEQATDWQVQRLEVGDAGSGDPLPISPGCRSIIGLGRAGLAAAKPLVPGLPVVAGAVLMQPDQSTDVPTISFVPSADELFARLKHFLPGAKRVTVIYDPENSAGVVAKAGEAAARMGLELVALEAENLRDAAVLYKRVLKDSKSKRDAIWLIRDPSAIDSGAVLTLVLEQAWKRKLVVFSDQVNHVRHGVLFSVFPDNGKLGKRLAALAEKCANGDCDEHGVMLLHDLGTAVNIRTANRLGIHVDRRNDPYADLILPAK